MCQSRPSGKTLDSSFAFSRKVKVLIPCDIKAGVLTMAAPAHSVAPAMFQPSLWVASREWGGGVKSLRVLEGK